MRSIVTRALSVLAVFALFATSFVVYAAQPPKVGEAPPEIKSEGFLNASGDVTLAAMKGKVVVVEFWATWCPPCRKSIPHLIELNEKFGKDGLVIVGLSDEGKDVVEPFAKDNKMSYVVGFGSKSGGDYGVKGIPTAFVVGKDGKLAWSGHPMKPEFEAAIEAALAKK